MTNKEKHEECQKKIEEILNLSREEKINEEILLKQSLEEKNKFIEELETKNKDLYRQLLSLKADFENFRKRVEKEKQQKFFLGKIFVVEKVISLYEMFSQAIKSFDNIKTDQKQVVDGVKMIYSELESFLKKEGITKIDCVGKKFNPLHHEILEFEDSNDVEDNVIVSVLMEGYKIENGGEEIILKPAKVKVAKKVSNIEETQKQESASNNIKEKINQDEKDE